ncbi:amino acid ABC transporter permease [Desulfofalx alkaliphila]|uniref:amino acid ABC transporter permease n=1 Tax=Desulfofalx alkaliphila TaxID=105483 RepID=UPI0004E0EC13|nr:amino acid ABC transporter permease [Desulfofalx alkaliphila]
MEVIINALPMMIVGAGISLLITIVGITIGSVLGLISALARLSNRKFPRLLGTAYVDFFRGTPLLVQIMLVYFGIPRLIIILNEQWAAMSGSQVAGSFTWNIWVAVIITISLNSGAYIAEIFRGGIQSIEKGQMEAARSLGMTQAQAMRLVILPQAFKRIIPPMGNEFVILLKDSSLFSIIGFAELARVTQLEVARTYATFELWMTCAMIYLIMTITFSRLSDKLEERLKESD